MNYEKNYFDIINSIKREKRPKKNVEYELHHILPKSLGGTDAESNLILLTYREHYLAHYLLWKIYKNKEMMYSFWLMNNVRNKIKFKINSRVYENLKEEFIERQKKKVVCLETAEIFSSLKEAAKKNGLKDSWSIRIAVNNKKRIANGYHWDEYKEKVDYTKNKFYGKERKEFCVIRLEDGKKYRTYKEAAKDNRGISKTTVFDATTGKSLTANGYHWDKYKEDVDYTKSKFYGKERLESPSNYRKVLCIETGKIYNSQTEAAKDIGYKISGDIGKCCDGHLKTCGKYHWRRYEN